MRTLRKEPEQSVEEKAKAAHWNLFKEMVKAAAGGRTDIVWGKKLGKNPKYFLLGDEPILHDFVTGSPFSGVLNEIMVNAVKTLAQQYGATIEDCYITYIVKTTFQQHEFTENMFYEHWIPTIQLEYALSGCTEVVALTGAARQIIHRIPQKPMILNGKGKVDLSSRMEKAKLAWHIFRT